MDYNLITDFDDGEENHIVGLIMNAKETLSFTAQQQEHKTKVRFLAANQAYT